MGTDQLDLFAALERQATAPAAQTAADLWGWNPRFVIFAHVHGKTPSEARAAMKRREPPFFVIWINQRWAEWRALNKRERFCALHETDHVNFDAWLNTWATSPAAAMPEGGQG